MNMVSRFFPFALASVLMVCLSAFAQDYPSSHKSITFVLPYAAGGPTDKAARDLAQSISKAMGGQSIVIDNAAGASGSIGTHKVANTMAELVTWALANKGKININIANAGPGSASHLCGMLFQSTLKVDMTSVPYKGTAPGMTD